MIEDYRILKRSDIDTNAWDNCISNSVNGLIYGYSWYLDTICENWEGVVINEYEAVMPIPIRKKWGLKYIYQPAFIQQLGLFYTNNSFCNMERIEKLITQKYWHGSFNVNAHWIKNNKKIIATKQNMLLSLSNSYDNIYENYSGDFIRNLKKALNQALNYQESYNYADLIERYKLYYGNRFPHIKNSDYQRFQKLIEIISNNDAKWLIRSILNSKNEVLAEALLLIDNNRYYNIMNCVSAEGRKKSANYLLYDSLLKEIAGKPKYLDLEGSEVPGVKDFYEKFKPEKETYFVMKISPISFIISWI